MLVVYIELKSDVKQIKLSDDIIIINKKKESIST